MKIGVNNLFLSKLLICTGRNILKQVLKQCCLVDNCCDLSDYLPFQFHQSNPNFLQNTHLVVVDCPRVGRERNSVVKQPDEQSSAK